MNSIGRGWEKIVIRADGCYINGGDGGLEMVECLQFVDDFWMWVWYNKNRGGGEEGEDIAKECERRETKACDLGLGHRVAGS